MIFHFAQWHVPPTICGFADFSPGECSRTVEVVKQGRFTNVGGALTHIYTGLPQRAQVEPQSTLWWPNRDGFTAKILRRSRRKQKTDTNILFFQCKR